MVTVEVLLAIPALFLATHVYCPLYERPASLIKSLLSPGWGLLMAICSSFWKTKYINSILPNSYQTFKPVDISSVSRGPHSQILQAFMVYIEHFQCYFFTIPHRKKSNEIVSHSVRKIQSSIFIKVFHKLSEYLA